MNEGRGGGRRTSAFAICVSHASLRFLSCEVASSRELLERLSHCQAAWESGLSGMPSLAVSRKSLRRVIWEKGEVRGVEGAGCGKEMMFRVELE